MLSALLLGVGVAATAQETKETPAPGAQAAKPAVWKAKEINFSYSSDTARYSCSALETRVKTIFLALGAREDLQVRVSSCDEVVLDDEFETQIERGRSWDPTRSANRNRAWYPTGRTRAESAWEDPYDRFENRGTDREQNAYIRARLFMPVELTPEVMEEVRRDKSRRELISRVTGDSAAKENNPVWFPASWQPVALSRDSIGLESEECELLHQMSSVFKDLGLRVTGKGRRCSRAGSSPVFTMEALLMDTTGDTSLPQINVGGDLPQEGAPAAPAAPQKSDP